VEQSDADERGHQPHGQSTQQSGHRAPTTTSLKRAALWTRPKLKGNLPASHRCRNRACATAWAVYTGLVRVNAAETSGRHSRTDSRHKPDPGATALRLWQHRPALSPVGSANVRRRSRRRARRVAPCFRGGLSARTRWCQWGSGARGKVKARPGQRRCCFDNPEQSEIIGHGFCWPGHSGDHQRRRITREKMG
jgi:hypothetical protein